MGCEWQRSVWDLVIELICLPGLWPQATRLQLGRRACLSKEQLAQKVSSPKDRGPEYGSPRQWHSCAS
jgi:hypothetical protein